MATAAAKAAATKAAAQQPPTCTMCGKAISNPTSVAAGQGSLCAKHMAAGRNVQTLAAHRAAYTIGQPPNGFIKVAALHKVIVAAKAASPAKHIGLSVNAMVTAIGRDRALKPPIAPICQPLYLPNGHRYINGWLATPAGLTAIATKNYGKAPKQPTVKNLAGKVIMGGKVA